MNASSQSEQNPSLFAETLETERLRLRNLRPEDASDIFEYASDPEVTRHVRFVTHKTLEDTAAFLQLTEKGQREGSTVVWAITLKATGKMIGTCGLLAIAREHRRAELGYALNRSYWGKGCASEAARAVVAHGFKAMNFNRIEAHVSPDHTPSQRVLEKCGMRPEGILRQHEMIKGRWHDSKIYSILREEFVSTPKLENRN
jgi:ribosomal-protein-alanine N-acetyltransferase